MSLWTPKQTATVRTDILLDNLVELSAQMGQTKLIERKANLMESITVIKAELSTRSK